MPKWYQPALLVVLGAAGIGLIVVGAVLMFQHQHFEMEFQYKLLDKLGPDYHWRSMGDGYFGLGAAIAGAFLMAVAAGVALVNRALEFVIPNCLRPGAERAPAVSHRQLDPVLEAGVPNSADDPIRPSGLGA